MIVGGKMRKMCLIVWIVATWFIFLALVGAMSLVALSKDAKHEETIIRYEQSISVKDLEIDRLRSQVKYLEEELQNAGTN